MGTINAVRLININYNHNSMKINDEIMYFNGENTLVSLKNGGGKSVLVQMIMAPFVHKRFRDAKERPFESYFTSAKPSFILVEWKLDGGAGKLLTGLMIRRNQSEINSDQYEPLELTGLISYYREESPCDLHHLPVVEKSKKEMILKNYGACRQLFDGFKKDSRHTFFYYDLNMPAQARQYFSKLKEYKIDHKEWERIIKKVNMEESGLSDLFADCKDERGLIEKWFLETISEKLNQDNDRINEFQSIIDKHVRQYSENESKIKRRDRIRLFKQEVCDSLTEEADHAETLSGDQWSRNRSNSVEILAKRFVEKENREKDLENKIANYLRILKKLQEQTTSEIEHTDTLIRQMEETIARLVYEKYSCEISDLLAEKELHSRTFFQLQMEAEDLEKKMQQADLVIHQLEGAELYENRQKEYGELEELKGRQKLLDQSEVRKEPRRKELGSKLYLYYMDQCSIQSEKLSQCAEEIHKTEEKLSIQKSDLKNLGQKQIESEKRIASLQTKLQYFDDREEEYNQIYQGTLKRNILGKYEEGHLEILLEELESNEKNISVECKNSKKQLEEQQKNDYRITRDLEDAGREKNGAENDLINHQKDLTFLEKEVQRRKDLLKYLGLNEEKLYDKEAILHASDVKILEKETAIGQLSRQQTQLEKEYKALKEGTIIELPEELAETLTSLEIPIVFGLEWLKKNGKTVEENTEMVRNAPFLPYALLMSEREMTTLKETKEQVYTSFPVPIITREQVALGNKGLLADKGNPVFSLEGVSFYVNFNENYLDEVKLNLLLEEKQQEIAVVKEKIALRIEERNEYLRDKNEIENQKLTKELLQKTENQVSDDNAEILRLTEKIASLKKEQEENLRLKRQLEKTIKEQEKALEKLKRQALALKRLMDFYAEYLQQTEVRYQLEEELQKIIHKISLAEQMIKQLQDRRDTLRNQKNSLDHSYEEFEKKLASYKLYQVGAENPSMEKPSGEQVLEIEAEYRAMMEEISVERKVLENQIKTQQQDFDKAERKLKKHLQQYRLNRSLFETLSYNEEELEHQQRIRDDWEKEHKQKEKDYNKENVTISGLQIKIDERNAKMREETGQEEPLSGSELIRKNFDSEIRQLNYQKQGVKTDRKRLEEKNTAFNENIAGLAEYGELAIIDNMEQEAFGKDFSSMSGRELTDFKGMLVRDYHEIKEEKEQRQRELEKRLRQLTGMEAFADEYFMKPLEAMLRLVDTPQEVLRQIDTTIRSYDDLMEKIAVDLSFIDKERTEIIAQLLDYIKEVHENLGKIDSNSTIKIHDRSVKMLKIHLPVWEENAGMYENHMKDFMEEITKKGVELYRNNENVFNYFGTRINTKNLYDVVVGTSHVQIKLFKVEQYKEYPITWAEVAKNSGGEGFLSSFIILSSLLFYMRRDDNDIFADHNEGKVLVMDNPFAATYSEHLLKPLMEMAKKNHTQLICLTGLGGDSIYGRFDNIYVLNLVSAGLKRGLQYLRTEHVRGNEPEMMTVSHIEVTEPEQLQLEF